jgi:vesicle-fusing ATPase
MTMKSTATDDKNGVGLDADFLISSFIDEKPQKTWIRRRCETPIMKLRKSSSLVLFCHVLISSTQSCYSWIYSAVPTNIVALEKQALSSPLKPLPTESDDMTAFEVLAGNIGLCLIQSDLKRDSGFDGSSTGWTSWVDRKSAFRLEKCIEKLTLASLQVLDPPSIPDSAATKLVPSSSSLDMTTEKDELISWLRWIKASPSPMVVELTETLRQAVNATVGPDELDSVGQSWEEFTSRIALRLFLLPSGASLANTLRTEPGAMVYGKLLYGGVTRYRVIGNTNNNGRKRRAGERTVIAGGSSSASESAWLQYGGPERNYDAVDMGPCGFMELTILPKGSDLPLAYAHGENEAEDLANALNQINEMTVAQAQCNLNLLLEFPAEKKKPDSKFGKSTNGLLGASASSSIDGMDSLLTSDAEFIDGLETTFTTVVGGLRKQIDAIIRRVLDSRVVIPPGADPSVYGPIRAREVKEMLHLGLQPVRGLLLHGPPGCGKTALAREISRLLTDRPPKIVSAPELLDRWVGGSEKLVRGLFADAELELTMCNEDPTKSGLHVVVIDEIDAVFRKRSSATDSGEVVRASAVNQILAKLDGIKALSNVLVIGTTNRRELLDEALLRPGRLEVHIEVPLPDKEGRREILNIHFGVLRRRGRLSRPLCEAIDGPLSSSSSSLANKNEKCDSELPMSTFSFFAQLLAGRVSLSRRQRRRLNDLAADRWTGGFSGADLSGLVRCSGSLALARARRDGSGVEGLLITLEDVMNALEEIKTLGQLETIRR